MNQEKIIPAVAAFCTALIAGVFYAFVVAVNPGLGRLPDATYLSAMQSINSAIVNPPFGICFFGAPVFLIIASVTRYRKPEGGLIIAATIVYFAGSLAVTVWGNIPLNEKLAAIDILTASPEKLRSARSGFAGSWNQWHAVRTVAASLSFIMLLFAIGKKEKKCLPVQVIPVRISDEASGFPGNPPA